MRELTPNRPGLAIYVRCGAHADTLLHGLYVCSDNDNLTDESITSTQHMAEQAVQEAHTNGAMWLGCVMPRSKAMKRPLKIRRSECNYRIDGPLVEAMRITGQAGVDGGGGTLSKTVFRCVGAGGSAILSTQRRRTASYRNA